MEPRHLLAAYNVTTVSDTIADDGLTSLREALALANSTTANDTITFANSLAGETIQLTGQLSINSDVTIVGLGVNRFTIDAHGNGRAFSVASGVTTTIQDLKITGGQLSAGNVGGGIFSNGNLTLQNVDLTDNHVTEGSAGNGGGIFSDGGSLTIKDSTIENNSAHWVGGVDVRLGAGKLLTITGSAFLGNSGGSGGGITIQGETGNQVKIANSTFSGNTSYYGGGGLYIFSNANVSITNCTIVNNTATAGGGGGILSGSANTLLTNSIVAQNHAPTWTIYHTHDDLVGTFSSGSSYNFLGNAGWSGLVASNHNLGGFNLDDVTPNSADPLLAPLAFYGGQTKTFALLPNSPEIDKGSNALALDEHSSPLIFDQRGSTRVVDVGYSGPTNGTVDIGAYELQIPSSLEVSTTADTIDGRYGPGELSLREALAIAALTPYTKDVISFAPALYASAPATITLAYGMSPTSPTPLPLAAKNVEIDGPGADKLTIDAAGHGLVMYARDTTIKGVTITGGKEVIVPPRQLGGSNGGGIQGFNLDIENSRIVGNSSTANGGGIDVEGSLILLNSELSGNTSTSSGGGLYIWTPTGAYNVAIVNSTISGNQASSGGGISVYSSSYNYGWNFGITNSTIAKNVSSNGGGIYFRNGSGYAPLVQNTIIAGNIGTSGAANDIGGDAVDSNSKNNLIGYVPTGSGWFTDSSNQSHHTATAPLDPGLALLAFNGGTTQTHALLPSSPAIDAGLDELAINEFGYPLDTDQRGMARFIDNPMIAGDIGSSVDIGAYEFADPIVVSTSYDADDGFFGPQQLSLREALRLADQNPGPDVIVFDPTVGNILLDSSLGPLIVSSNVSIIGPGADKLAIDAQRNSRVFDIVSGATAEISKLTIKGGDASVGGVGANHDGGGILVDGHLTLDSVEVRDNYARSGAGIYVSGGSGGAWLEVRNSTVAQNNAVVGAGGIQIAGGSSNYVHIDSSTISNNIGEGIAWGSGGATNGEIQLNDVTVASNTGIGIDSTTTTVKPLLRNSIVIDNGIYDLSGAFGPLSTYDLVGTQNQSGFSNSNHNRIGITTSQVVLSPLAENGGGTRTRALLPGSVAIDAGADPIATEFDQRGFVRTVTNGLTLDHTSDIGAFEYVSSLVVNTVDDNPTSVTLGELTLRQALWESAQESDLNAITFSFGLKGSIVLDQAQGELEVGSNVSIAGPGSGNLLIDASNKSRVLNVGSGFNVSISGVTLTHGSAVTGGGIYSEGNLTLSDVFVVSNYATEGGGIYQLLGSLSIDKSQIDSNSASAYAGGVLADTPYVVITNTAVTLNTTSGSVGGLYLAIGGTLTNTTVSSNHAAFEGGILVTNGDALFTNVTDTRNTANSGTGAGLAMLVRAHVKLINTIVVDNLANGVNKDISGTLDSTSAYNLVRNDGSGTSGGLLNTTTHPNIILSATGSAGLGDLADNGGTTKTHLLLTGSPAVDHGIDHAHDSSVPTTDQRGVARPVDSGDPDGDGMEQDIGAAEDTTGFLLDLDPATAGQGSIAIFVPGEGTVPIAPNAIVTGYVTSIRVSFYGDPLATESLAGGTSNGVGAYFNGTYLTIGGIGSVADFVNVLRSVTYLDTSTSPTGLGRDLLVTVYQGSVAVGAATATIAPMFRATVQVTATQDAFSNTNSNGTDYLNVDADHTAYIQFFLNGHFYRADQASFSDYVLHPDDGSFVQLDAYNPGNAWTPTALPSTNSFSTLYGTFTAIGAEILNADFSSDFNAAIDHGYFSVAFVPHETGSQTISLQSKEDGGDVLKPTLTVSGLFSDSVPKAEDDDGYSVYVGSWISVDHEAGVIKNDSDLDKSLYSDEPQIAQLVTDPSQGTVTLNADGSFVYRANTDAVGTDTFTYRVFDGITYSNTATVKITIKPALVNDYSTVDELLHDVNNSVNTPVDVYYPYPDRLLTTPAQGHNWGYYFTPGALEGGGAGNSDPFVYGIYHGVQAADHTSYVQFSIGDLPDLSTIDILSVRLQLRDLNPPPIEAWGWSRTDADTYPGDDSGIRNPLYQDPYYMDALHGTPLYEFYGVHDDWTPIEGSGIDLSEDSGQLPSSITSGSPNSDYITEVDREVDLTDYVLQSLTRNDSTISIELKSNPYTLSSTGFYSSKLGGASAPKLIISYILKPLNPLDPPDNPTQNLPPSFLGTPKSTANVDETYSARLIATDPENDPLQYALPLSEIRWPAGYVPKASDIPTLHATNSYGGSWFGPDVTMTWTPSEDLVGKTVTFKALVRDNAGHVVSESFSVLVQWDPANSPPVIFANPATKYNEPEQLVPNTNDAYHVNPDYISISLGDGLTTQIPVSITVSPDGLRSEILFVIDDSASMDYGFNWLGTVIQPLDEALEQKGFSDRVYGVALFSTEDSSQLQPIEIGSSYWASAQDVANTLAPLRASENGEELGYDALMDATNASGQGVYAFKTVGDPANTSSQIVLLTDEDVDGFTSQYYSDPAEGARQKELYRQDILNALTNEPETTLDNILFSVIINAHHTALISNDEPPNFEQSAGSWKVSGNAYQPVAFDNHWAFSTTPSYLDSSAIGVQVIGEGSYNYLHAQLQIDAAGGNGYIVFDYHANNDFKFVEAVDGGTSGRDVWRVGYQSPDGLVFLQEFDAPNGIDIGSTYDVQITLGPAGSSEANTKYNGAIYVAINGAPLQSSPTSPQGSPIYFDLDDDLYDGTIGFATYSATNVATTSFKGIEVSTINGPLERELPKRDNDVYKVAYIFDPDDDGTSDHNSIAYPLLGYMGSTEGNVAFLPDSNSTLAYARGTYGQNVYDWSNPSPGSAVEDYASLALATGGSVWDIGLLRDVDSHSHDAIADSFTHAFSDAIAAQTVLNMGPIVPVAQDGDPTVIGLTPDFADTDPSTPGQKYLVDFKGDGASHAFDVDFDQNGALQATIPVRITAPYVVHLNAIDPDGATDDPLTFSWANGYTPPAGAELVSSDTSPGAHLVNDVLVFNPPYSDTVHTYTFSVTVTDRRHLSAVHPLTWTLTVNPPAPNAPPVIDGGMLVGSDAAPAFDLPTVAERRRAYSFQVVAHDPDKDRLRYFLMPDAPSTMSIDHNKGIITWIPGTDALSTVSFGVRVSDGYLTGDEPNQDTESFTIHVINPTYSNLAPELQDVPTQVIALGDTMTLQMHAHDPNGDPITYSLLSNIPKMSIVGGLITWTPTRGDANQITMVGVEASDGNKTDTTWFAVLVTAEDHAPTITSTPQAAGVGVDFIYPLTSKDDDGDEVTYTFTGPTGMQLQRDATGAYTLIWPKEVAKPGLFPVTVTADDGHGGRFTQSFNLDYKPVPPPQFSGSVITRTNASHSYSTSFNLSSLSRISNLPAALSLDDASKALGLSFDFSEVISSNPTSPSGLYEYSRIKIVWASPIEGTYPITITAKNDAGSSSTTSFTLTVLKAIAPAINSGPVFLTKSIGPFAVGQNFDFTLDIEDPDGDQLDPLAPVTLGENPQTPPDFSSDNLSGDGRITWTPSQTGDFVITVIATDANHKQTPHDYAIHVAANASPVIKGGVASPAFKGKLFSYPFTAVDPNPDDTLTITVNPEADAAGVHIIEDPNSTEPGAELLQWQVPSNFAGTAIPLAIEVTDGRGGDTKLKFPMLPVYDSSDPEAPIDPSEAIHIPAGRPFQFRYQLQSAVSNGFHFSFANPSGAPANASISDDGVFQWTPGYMDIGHSLSIHIVAIPSTVGATPPEVDLTLSLDVVQPSEFESLPPNITSDPPKSATAGELFSYSPQLSSNGGLVVQPTWSIKGPKDISIDPGTGRVSWLPSKDDIGATDTVEIFVVDAFQQSTSQKFTLTVNAVNAKPVLDSSLPQLWPQSLTFDVTVRAHDPDGNPITFALLDSSGAALPAGQWVIDPSSGHMHWSGTGAPPAQTYNMILRVQEKESPTSYTDFAYPLTISATTWDVKPTFMNTPNGTTASVGHEFAFPFEALDPDSSTLTYNVDLISPSAPSGAPVPTMSNGIFRWTPSDTEVGHYTITVSANDGHSSGFVKFDLDVIKNDAPIIDISDDFELAAVVGTGTTYQVSARDPEGGALKYSFDGTHPDMSIDPNTGLIHWNVPTTTTTAPYPSVTVRVTDQWNVSSTKTIHYHADADTIPPTVSLSLVDGQGNVILPGSDITADNGELNCSIMVNVDDNLGADNAEWRITVENTGGEPVEEPYLPGGLYQLPFNSEANPGLLTITIEARDPGSINKPVTKTVTYHIEDPSEDGTAKLSNVKSLLTIDSPFDVTGIAHFEQIPDSGGDGDIFGGDGGFDDEGDDGGDSDPTPQFGAFNLKLTSVSDPSDVVSLVENGTANISGVDQPLATIDPTLLPSGLYNLYLEVLDGPNGAIQAVDEREIEIRNDSHLGNLDLSFTDLQTQLNGIPIALVRSYNSSLIGPNNTVFGGDFGPGWTLNLLQSHVTVSHPRQITTSLNDAFADGTRIYVQLPDGTTQRFTFEGVDQGNGQYRPTFIPDPDVISTLSIADFDDSLLIVPNGISNDGTYVTAVGGNAFIPANFGSLLTVTTQAGLQYEFDIRTGKLSALASQDGTHVDIKEVPNAIHSNQKTIELSSAVEAGDSSSQKVSIHFTDDRIDWIADPNNKQVVYSYGAANSTVSVPSDMLGKVTTPDSNYAVYNYGESLLQRDLTDIYDQTSAHLMHAEYDLDPTSENFGRLIGLTNAGGHTAELSFSLHLSGGRTATALTTDGLTTTQVVDSHGNLLRTLQPVLGSLGNVDTDKLLVTVYNYQNSLLQRQSVSFVIQLSQLPDGQDEFGYTPANLTWSQTNYYDDGRLQKTVDALGGTTVFVYDENGRVTATTSPSGATSHNVYDPNTGDLLETYATVGSSDQKLNDQTFVYESGRQTKTYQGDLLTSQTHYDDAGQIDWSMDATGQKQYYEYDGNGNQTYSWRNWTDPATTNRRNVVVFVSKTEYDGQNRVVGTTDYELHQSSPTATIETAEALNTTLGATPIAVSSTGTHYDPQDRIDYSTDQFGNSTYSTYDVHGNLIEARVQTIDPNNASNPGWLITRTLYDDHDRVVFKTDQYFATATQFGAGANLAVQGTYTVYDKLDRATSTQRYAGVTLTISGSPGQQSISLPTGWDWQTSGTKISEVTTAFDDLGRVDHTVSEIGARTDYYYDNAGNQSAVLGPIELVNGVQVRTLTESVFDTAGHVVQSNANVIISSWGTDLHPDITRDTTMRDDSADENTFFEFDKFGRQTAVISTEVHDPDSTDPNVFTHLRTETVYNELGQKIAVRNGIKQAIPADPSTIDRSHQHETDYEYDAHGHLTAVVLPAVIDTSLSGSPLVRPRYEYTYDQYGNQLTIRDNIYQTAQGIFYQHGGTAGDFSQNYNTRVTQYAYDEHNREISRTLPLGVDSSTNPDDCVERIVYDDTPVVPTASGAASSVGNGELKYSVDLDGRATAYLYDNTTLGGGRLVTKLFFDAGAYDDGTGTPTESCTYTYDEFGRVLTTTDDSDYANPSNPLDITSTTYDAQGHVITTQSSAGTIHYEYDKVTGQLLRTYTGLAVTGGITGNASYSPQPSDHAAVTDTEYQYDGLGRLSKVIVHERFDTPLTQPETTKYFYDAAGNLDYMELPNDVITDYVYDQLNRLKEEFSYKDMNANHHQDTGEATISRYDYKYDIYANKVQSLEIDPDGKLSETDWVYDALGRLTSEKYDFDTTNHHDTTDYLAIYKFDLVGNRLEKDVDNGLDNNWDEKDTFSYDRNDRLTQETVDNLVDNEKDEVTDYKYGNGPGAGSGTAQTLKTDTIGTASPHVYTTTYEYDVRGRLASTTINESSTGGDITVTQYKYDAFGNRIEQDVQINGGTPTKTIYLVDLNNPTGFSQTLEEKDGAGVVTKTYTLGLDVHTLATSAGAVYHHLYDGHGSTRALLDAAGAVLQKYAYDAYGNLQALSGYVAAVSAAYTSLLYSGEQTDKSGVQYLRSRYYDATTGRFTSFDSFNANDEDPLALHKYLYCGSDPVNGADPTGQYDESGHFWTTYMVAMAAGLSNNANYSPSDAFELAYYSQLPDEVEDFDATSQTEFRFGRALNEDIDFAEDQWSLNVNYYLHSLTGGGAAQAALNRAVLKSMVSNSSQPLWQRGFLIHAYGDAYAHVNENGEPYGPEIGHLFAGHTPDYIPAYPGRYRDFVFNLYGALGGQGDPGSNPLIGRLLDRSRILLYDVTPDGSRWLGDKWGAGHESFNSDLMARLAREPIFRYTFDYVPGAAIGSPNATLPNMYMPTRDDANSLFGLIDNQLFAYNLMLTAFETDLTLH